MATSPTTSSATDDGSAPDRRAQILDATLELISESGTRGTTIAAVAKAVGITDAGVLHHFHTKQDLLVAAIELFDARILDDLDVSGARGIEYLRVMRSAGAVMEAVPGVSAVLIKLSAEQLTGDSAVRAVIQRRYRWMLDRLVAAFATAAREGDLRADLDPVHEASALVAHLDGIRMQWFLLDGEVSMADSVRAYVDGVLERLAPGVSER